MKKLSDFVVISDVDGTLLDHNMKIPQRNINAIRRFIDAGGRFGIATGRSKGLMLESAGDLPINCPCVLYNGGALYDYSTEETLWEIFLPDSSENIVADLMEAVPGVGVLVISSDSYYQIREERAFAGSVPSRLQAKISKGSLGQLKEPWYKVLFQVQPEFSDSFYAVVGKKAYPGVRFVSTSHTLIEMLPEQSSKGVALEKMIELGLVERENLVCIGDFYNDREMIELAGIGVTLCDSPEDLKALADVVVGDCQHGAVADIIEHLERLCAAQ